MAKAETFAHAHNNHIIIFRDICFFAPRAFFLFAPSGSCHHHHHQRAKFDIAARVCVATTFLRIDCGRKALVRKNGVELKNLYRNWIAAMKGTKANFQYIFLYLFIFNAKVLIEIFLFKLLCLSTKTYLPFYYSI